MWTVDHADTAHSVSQRAAACTLYMYSCIYTGHLKGVQRSAPTQYCEDRIPHIPLHANNASAVCDSCSAVEQLLTTLSTQELCILHGCDSRSLRSEGKRPCPSLRTTQRKGAGSVRMLCASKRAVIYRCPINILSNSGRLVLGHKLLGSHGVVAVRYDVTVFTTGSARPVGRVTTSRADTVMAHHRRLMQSMMAE